MNERRWQRRSRTYPVVLMAITLFFVFGEGRLTADEVTKWNEIAGRASLASGLSEAPPFDSRVHGMTHAAVHDALNAIERRYMPYWLEIHVTPSASPEAAVATAAHHVLMNQYSLLSALGFPSQQAMFDNEYLASLALIPNGPAKTAGIGAGSTAAAAILALRASDGWNQQTVQDFGYPQGDAPGEYRFTPPADFVFLPGWGNVPPFALFRANQFRPNPPYKVDSKRYTADFKEVKALGGDGVTTPSTRTPDQTQIALFWYESSPVGWNRIARTVSVARELDLWENARLFALINLASADGYIAAFDAKYHYNFWRPITAIRLAGTDGNPDTSADAGWTPLLPTPAIPDYPSGHAVQGGAAAEMMKLFFGKDQIAFRTCSTTMPSGSKCNEPSQVSRPFSAFSEAAEENALSRILVGIHFRDAVSEGMEQGRKIAQQTFLHYLRPLQ